MTPEEGLRRALRRMPEDAKTKWLLYWSREMYALTTELTHASAMLQLAFEEIGEKKGE